MVKKSKTCFQMAVACVRTSGLFPQVCFLMFPYAALIMDVVPKISNVQRDLAVCSTCTWTVAKQDAWLLHNPANMLCAK